jgi:hypothetical protein
MQPASLQKMPFLLLLAVGGCVSDYAAQLAAKFNNFLVGAVF